MRLLISWQLRLKNKYAVDPGVIKRSSNDQIAPDWGAPLLPPTPPLRYQSHKPPQMGLCITVNYLLPGAAGGCDKERSVSNMLDQHQKLSYWWCDVVRCRWSYCWFSQFGNQKPEDPRSPQSYVVKLPFNPSTTPDTHRHKPPPRPSSPPPPVEPLLNSGKTIPAHHTSISN